MDEQDDPAKLQRRLAQVTRLSSRVTDQTTVERFKVFADELGQKLQRALVNRRARIAERKIRARAYEIWEQNGRPVGRDEEFWVQAERETEDRLLS